MPATPHIEKHFTSSETVRDVVIGMSDGLTVPFALAAGLSGAVDASSVIITAGLAEVAAGAIAMGLGGYLAARTDAEHFNTEREREERETVEMPEEEAEEVASIFRAYGLKENTVQDAVTAIRSDRNRWIDFMMKYELGIGRTRSETSKSQCLDDCRFVHCWRSNSAGSIFLYSACASCSNCVSHRDAAGFGCLRLH